MSILHSRLLCVTVCLMCVAIHAKAGGEDAAKPDQNRNALTNQIVGAFGLKLGDKFDIATGVFVEMSRPRVRFVAYQFYPQKPLPPFETYFVEITPRTHKIWAIAATVSEDQTNVWKQLEVVRAALLSKYGENLDADFAGNYATARGSKVIQLMFERVANPGHFILRYWDKSLEDLASTEREALKKAENDSEHDELQQKVKSLDKSGL